MQTAARQIIEKLKEDKKRYSVLLKSVEVKEEPLEEKSVTIEGTR
ncbi:MAG: hypothetical protein ACPW60_15295 [Methylohalobius sp. ZOD2]